MRRNTQRQPYISSAEIAKQIETNERTREIHDLLQDAVYMAQVPSFAAAVDYAKEVSFMTMGPVNLHTLSWDEAWPIFNYVVKARRHG